jgi:putative transposase
MPRPPRISAAGLTFHVVQRGNDRHRTFFDAADYRAYLLLLNRISSRYLTGIHAYALMTNHVHLLMTSRRVDGISLTMQQTASSYGRYINKRYERTGTLWEGRFRSSPVDTDYYCLACYRYIELNPVRAGIVALPGDYRWSSYRENTGERGISIVIPHPSFLAIAASETQRNESYAEIVNEGIGQTTLEQIRKSTATGAPIGDRTFCQTVERETGVSLERRRPGRPRKSGPPDQGTLNPRSEKGL